MILYVELYSEAPNRTCAKCGKQIGKILCVVPTYEIIEGIPIIVKEEEQCGNCGLEDSDDRNMKAEEKMYYGEKKKEEPANLDAYLE